MLPPDITHRQACVLRYMATFLAANDQLPTMQSMATAFGWASPESARCHMRALEKKGYLQRNDLGKHMIARTDKARQVIHSGGFMGAYADLAMAKAPGHATATIAATRWPPTAAITTAAAP